MRSVGFNEIFFIFCWKTKCTLYGEPKKRARISIISTVVPYGHVCARNANSKPKKNTCRYN